MKARTLLSISALALATVVLCACNRDRDGVDDMEGPPQTNVAPPDTAAPAADTGAAGAPTPEGQPSAAVDPQGETLALVIAVDEHEIAAAEQARTKNPSKPVLDYANMLHGEHSKNLQADREIARTSSIDPQTTTQVTAQREKGQAELRSMAALDGKAYEDAYVDAMVKGHTEALALIDGKMPTINDTALKQHLTTTREHIARHLERGKELQAERK